MALPMRLNTVDTLQLVPAYMRGDEAVKGLAKASNKTTQAAVARANTLSTWGQIQDLTGPELDQLARELNIIWYLDDAPLEVRRQIVNDAPLVFRRLGTCWAVETVMSAYFGDAQVIEWWEYGAPPHHFQLVVRDYATRDESEAVRLLELVKRKSQHCDLITRMENFNAPVQVGAHTQDSGWTDFMVEGL